MVLRTHPDGGRRRGVPRRPAFLLLSGVILGVALAVPAAAQPRPVQAPITRDAIAGFIAEASRRYGIPEDWIRAVLRAESAGDLHAVSSAGAMGLMQIMPATWTDLRARHGLGRDPFDPRDNILAGTAYLREMLDRYGSIDAMLAAYNAGPGRYDDHLATGRPLPAETRNYVAILSPLLGGDAATVIPVAAPPPPPDWRDAPLFVGRFNGDRATPISSPEPTSDDRPVAPPLQPDRIAEPHRSGIFLARRDPGGGS